MFCISNKPLRVAACCNYMPPVFDWWFLTNEVLIMKKAQIAMETIMIYGAALLVVTLAIGALIYFGVLDLGKLLPDKCETGSQVACESFVLSEGGDNIQLEFRNRVGKNIVLQSVSVDGVEDWTGISCTVSPALTVLNGDLSSVITLDSCSFPSGSTGKKIKAGIVVGYTVGDSAITQKATGELQATVAE